MRSMYCFDVVRLGYFVRVSSSRCRYWFMMLADSRMNSSGMRRINLDRVVHYSRDAGDLVFFLFNSSFVMMNRYWNVVLLRRDLVMYGNFFVRSYSGLLCVRWLFVDNRR